MFIIAERIAYQLFLFTYHCPYNNTISLWKSFSYKKNLKITLFAQFPKNTWSEIATLSLYSDDNYKTIKNKNLLVMLASIKTMLFDVSKHHVAKSR